MQTGMKYYLCTDQLYRQFQKQVSVRIKEFYLRSPVEMWKIFGDELSDALHNTVDISERCNVKLEFGQYMLPEYKVPEGETLESYLALKAKEDWPGGLATGNTERVHKTNGI